MPPLWDAKPVQMGPISFVLPCKQIVHRVQIRGFYRRAQNSTIIVPGDISGQGVEVGKEDCRRRLVTENARRVRTAGGGDAPVGRVCVQPIGFGLIDHRIDLDADVAGKLTGICQDQLLLPRFPAAVEVFCGSSRLTRGRFALDRLRTNAYTHRPNGAPPFARTSGRTERVGLAGLAESIKHKDEFVRRSAAEVVC